MSAPYTVLDALDEKRLGEPEKYARLIVAAPELLLMLNIVTDYLDCIPESAAGGDDEAVQLVRQCRATIAKATEAV